MGLHLQLMQMVHSDVTIVYIYRINGFPCIVLRRHIRDEPFVVQHIHHHHLNHDPPFRELEEQISEKSKNSIGITIVLAVRKPVILLFVIFTYHIKEFSKTILMIKFI